MGDTDCEQTADAVTKEENVDGTQTFGCPPPPVLGKVTHHSLELVWEEHLQQLNRNKTKGDGRVRVCIQEEDSHHNWANVYTGYGKKYNIEGLEPHREYRYRMKFISNTKESEWSPVAVVSTIKEPLCGEHLSRAVQRKDSDEIERILDTGEVNIDTPDKLGFTALMHACQKGYREIAETLLKKGADANLGNDSDKTPLMMACFAGQLECVRLLRTYNADYHSPDKGGSTAIHWAVDGGNADLLYWVLEDGANVNIRDVNSGWTPLLRCASVNGNYEVASALLLNNADINAQDNDGKTALMVAVINGHIQLLDLLLQRNADILIKNCYGKTAYEMALTMDRRRIIKTIEDHCAKKNIKMR